MKDIVVTLMDFKNTYDMAVDSSRKDCPETLKYS